MKRILFLTPFTPSEIGAAVKFTKKTIEQLSQTYNIDLLYHKTEEELPYIPNNKNVRVIEVCNLSKKSRLLSVIQRPWLFPLFTVRYRRSIVRLIKKYEKENHYDLIFLDHSQSFIYGKYFKNTPKILMSHDVIYQRVSRISKKLLAWWCRKSESKMICQENSHIFSFSTKDKEIIKQTYGVDSYVTCGNIDDEAIKVLPERVSNDYAFFGYWGRKDNSEGLEWFLKEVYPQTPDNARIKIIGKGLKESLCEYIKGLERVEYLGFVDNPYKIIANCRAVLSPLFSGAGVKFKVLESIACGTPVIGSQIAFEGIPEDFSEFMINASTPDEYIRKMSAIDTGIEHRLEFKQKFISEYFNPYLIKHIHKILD